MEEVARRVNRSVDTALSVKNTAVEQNKKKPELVVKITNPRDSTYKKKKRQKFHSLLVTFM